VEVSLSEEGTAIYFFMVTALFLSSTGLCESKNLYPVLRTSVFYVIVIVCCCCFFFVIERFEVHA
jgi:ammonia channel protein AmtB